MKKKILIIDDEEDFTKLIKLNLERTRKYEVKIENRGLSGFDTALAFKPDLILLDILMPDTDGSVVAAQLKDDKDTRNIPIVFLTAVVSKEEVREDEGVIGGNSFVSKPVDIQELIDVIDKNI